MVAKQTGKSYTDAACLVDKALTYFIGERGCGQGDVPSTTIWPAAYDILVVALSLALEDRLEGEKPDKFLIMHPNN